MNHWETSEDQEKGTIHVVRKEDKILIGAKKRESRNIVTIFSMSLEEAASLGKFLQKITNQKE